MEDPQFAPGERKTAIATMTNPTDRSWTYTAELYLGIAKTATSGLKSFTIPAGGSLDVSFPVTMPSAEGSYPVFIDVYVAGALIAAYQGTEDVVVAVVPAIEVGPIVWAGR